VLSATRRAQLARATGVQSSIHVKSPKFLVPPVVIAALAALCVATAGAAPIQAGNTGWAWSNPLPQGNSLDSVAASGGRIWAGGATGTLLHSDDGGSHWAAVRTGLLDDVRTLVAVSPQSVIFAGRCALRRTDDGGVTVRRLAWGSSDDNCPATIQAVAFPAPLIGYLLLSNGDVYGTDDGGTNWRKQGSVPGASATGGGEAVRDMYFSGLSTGVLSVGGKLFQTTDAGQSWTPVKSLPAGGQLDIEFVGSGVGYAAGDHSGLLRTTDGGATWNTVGPSDDPLQAQNVRSLACAGPSTCLAALASGDSLLRTTDGGQSWTAVKPGDQPVGAVVFFGPADAVAVGTGGATLISHDAGTTWSPVNSVASGAFRGLRAEGSSRALIFGDAGALAVSSDGGGSWIPVPVNTGQSLVDAVSTGPRNTYTIDDAGRFYALNPDGRTWRIVVNGRPGRPLALAAWKPNVLATIGPRGIWRASGPAAPAKRIGGPVARLTLSRVDNARGATFAYGPRAIAVTSDTGRSWRRVARPRGSSAIVRLDMLDAGNGFLLDSNAELYSTRNGGGSWSRIETTGANVAVSMAFGDRRHGYLTDNTGRVLATSDGGATWVRQYPFYDSSGASNVLVASSGRQNALTLVQGTNRVFSTSSGGRIGSSSLLTIAPSSARVRSGSLVRVTGRLTPATGTERVTVLARVVGARGGTRWTSLERTVSATGTFTTTWKITAPTQFIARWSGDAAHDGDAAPLKTVGLRR
jgi:photosystem II stability/assembly factor-like uncharacterized protein